MAPFNTFLGILILAIPLALAMPRYTETISFQVTSLEANDAYCGYNGWPHNCWKYCGEAGEWCWLQPDYYCLKSSDCYPEAPCSSPCDRDKDKKLPLDAPHVRPVTTQAIFEKPVTNAVKAVAPSVQFSDSSVSADALLTSPEASFYDAHCGYSFWPHSCWRYCGDMGEWCWILRDFTCHKDSDCHSQAPCYSACGRGRKVPDSDFEGGNHGILVKLLIA